MLCAREVVRRPKRAFKSGRRIGDDGGNERKGVRDVWDHAGRINSGEALIL